MTQQVISCFVKIDILANERVASHMKSKVSVVLCCKGEVIKEGKKLKKSKEFSSG